MTSSDMYLKRGSLQRASSSDAASDSMAMQRRGGAVGGKSARLRRCELRLSRALQARPLRILPAGQKAIVKTQTRPVSLTR